MPNQLNWSNISFQSKSHATCLAKCRYRHIMANISEIYVDQSDSDSQEEAGQEGNLKLDGGGMSKQVDASADLNGLNSNSNF